MTEETLETLDRLLVEAAELGNFAELACSDEEQPMWWLVDNEEQSLVIEWDEGLQRLMLSTEIGVLPEQNQVDALKQALYYNLVWQQTGGGRMALMPEDDCLRLMIDLPAEQLEAARVADVANNLLQAARDWRAGWDESTAMSGDAASSTDRQPGENQLPPSGFIRV